jgi:hypothetical protein
MTRDQRRVLRIIVCAAGGEVPGRQARKLLLVNDCPIPDTSIGKLARDVLQEREYSAGLSAEDRVLLEQFA